MGPELMISTSFMLYNPSILVLSAFFFLITASSSSSSSLSFNFYGASCPGAEFMVRSTVRSASEADPSIPGKLLRLMFHDCMVEGCDGSVLLEGNETERSDPANRSLGGFQVVESAKRLVEIVCPQTVSCADILALAARDAVEFTGGPDVQIPTGRRDGRSSSASNVRDNIVDTSFTMDQMVQIFSSKGLSLDDLVVLSGGHTIGLAHCHSFSDRFKNSNGSLMLVDASLDEAYAAQLAKQCPIGANAGITVSNDPETSLLFDNQYYQNLIEHKGLFQSDSVLFSDDRTRKQVEELASNQEIFFEQWANSFVKLASMNVKTGDEGEIRTICTAING